MGRRLPVGKAEANGNTIQHHLEKAFATVARAGPASSWSRPELMPASTRSRSARTLIFRRREFRRGSGSRRSMEPSCLRFAQQNCRYVSTEFHARFSAKGKVYRYRIWNAEVLPPLEHGRAWHVHTPLDFVAMSEETDVFVGTHEFSGFAANRGRPEQDTVRTMQSVRLRRRGKCLTVEISGDGFLYKMVRLMVGALVRRGRGQAAAGEIEERLLSPSRFRTRARLVAPAGGLYLVRVRY